MLLNSHISVYARCLAEEVCGLVWSTWGTSQGEDKPGAKDMILNTKVACRAYAPPLPKNRSADLFADLLGFLRRFGGGGFVLGTILAVPPA